MRRHLAHKFAVVGIPGFVIAGWTLVRLYNGPAGRPLQIEKWKKVLVVAKVGAVLKHDGAAPWTLHPELGVQPLPVNNQQFLVDNAVVDGVKAAIVTEGCSDGHVLIEQTHALYGRSAKFEEVVLYVLGERQHTKRSTFWLQFLGHWLQILQANCT